MLLCYQCVVKRDNVYTQYILRQNWPMNEAKIGPWERSELTNG